MKKIIMFFTLFLTAVVLHAQIHIEKSEAFDEPLVGWNKVLQLKNGNTFYFHFTKKDGIEVNVFDKGHKPIVTKNITSEVWNARQLRSSAIEGLYEVNGEPVLFLLQADGRTPTLYRVRFNANTGDVVKDEEIGALPKIKFIGGNGNSDVFVEKDPTSDCYAVIYFNGFASDKDERIRVVHYDGSHKAINTAYYESPDESFRYLIYIGAVVDGNKRVFIGTYGANSLKGRNGHVFVSRLNVTDSVFVNKTLDFTEDFKDTRSVMYYNHNSNTIQMLTLSYTSGKASFFTNATRSSYMSFLSFIDPESLSLKGVKPVMGQKVNEYAHTTLGLDIDYHGLPQQMVINKDNSITVLSEEQAHQVTINSQTNQVISASTTLGAISVSELSNDGAEQKGYIMIKSQLAAGLIDPLYIASRAKGRWAPISGALNYNSFMSFDYVNTEKGRYILFNDDNRNFGKDEDERKRKVTNNLNKMSTVCYSLTNGQATKSYLFGDTHDKDVSNTCYIDASDFNKTTNTYATIMIERDGRDRQAKMVWVTFE